MKTYSVKIERTVYSDKNYLVEADGELEASDIAVQLAEDEWNNTQSWVAQDWVFGCHEHESVYEEEYEDE